MPRLCHRGHHDGTNHEHHRQAAHCAVRKLEQFGYTFAGDDWMHPANDAAAITPTITDELHALLVKRADDLEARTEDSREERELPAIVRAIEAYEAVRWPHGTGATAASERSGAVLFAAHPTKR